MEHAGTVHLGQDIILQIEACEKLRGTIHRMSSRARGLPGLDGLAEKFLGGCMIA
jgi:hypothetical protein